MVDKMEHVVRNKLLGVPWNVIEALGNWFAQYGAKEETAGNAGSIVVLRPATNESE